MLEHQTMYIAMEYSQRINTLPGQVGEYHPGDAPTINLSFRKLTPQLKQKLIGLAIALLTGSLTNAQAISQLLRSLADQIDNGGTTDAN